MINNWQEVKLGEVLGKSGYIRGPFGSSLRRNELQSSGIPVYEQQHAIYNDRTFRYFIDDEKYKELSRFTVRENDLIVSCSGTLGKISIIQKDDPKGIISQALLILRPDVKVILPEYLYYFFTSPEGFYSLVSVSSGSVQVNLAKRSDIEKITFNLPPLPEQRAIAGILGALDDKIELNRRMNATLEAMARAVFRRWFVEGEEVGNWEVKTIGDICEFAYGKGLKADGRNAGAIPVYGSNGQIGWHNEHLVKGPGIVVGRKGNPGIVTWAQKDFFPIDTTFYVVPKDKETSLYWLYYTLISKNLPYLGADSAVPGLNRNIAYTSDVNYPPYKIMKQYDEFTKPIFDKINADDEESRTLARLRDALLPKLMRGEVRVKDIVS